MVDQMEFIYQNFENACNQYYQSASPPQLQQQPQQPQFNEEYNSYPSPPNASDLSHVGSSFSPLQLQFGHPTSPFLNPHLFAFSQQQQLQQQQHAAANFANINLACHPAQAVDLGAQLLFQQQLQQQHQRQQQLSPQHFISSPQQQQELSPQPLLAPTLLPQQLASSVTSASTAAQVFPSVAPNQVDPSTHCAKADQSKCDESDNKKKPKAKRVRTTFTPEQLTRLESEFADQGYLVGEYRNYLAKALHLSECQVKVWFQNRRIKKRKQEKQAAMKEQQ